MSTFAMYWLVMLDNIHDGLIALVSVASFVVLGTAFGVLVTTVEEMPELAKKFKTALKWSIAAALLIGTACVFIPNTKQVAIIIVVPKVISAVQESKELKAVPSKVLGLANAWLDELKPAKDDPNAQDN